MYEFNVASNGIRFVTKVVKIVQVIKSLK